MLSNHAYNLMNQLVEEHKSLWRIKDDYMKDADNCIGCKEYWEKLAKDKEAHISELLEMIKKEI